MRKIDDIPDTVFPGTGGQADCARPVLAPLVLTRKFLFIPEEIEPDYKAGFRLEGHGLIEKLFEFGRFFALIALFEFCLDLIAEFVGIEGLACIVAFETLVLVDVDQNPDGPVVAGDEDRPLCRLFEIPAGTGLKFRG